MFTISACGAMNYPQEMMMTSREQFEDKFEEITGWGCDDHPNRNYVDDLWEIWQASREAVEVELPCIEDKNGIRAGTEGFEKRLSGWK